MWDSLIVMLLALVLFGPRKLPQIGRQVGKLMYEFRKASNDFKFQMEEELRNAEDADRRKKEEERKQALALAASAAAPAGVTDASSAAIPSAAAVMESNYPDQTSYPPTLYPPLEDPVPAAIPETSAEETTPRIQPPSVGEQVAAAKPGSSALMTGLDRPAVHEPSAQTGAETVQFPGADELRANGNHGEDAGAEAADHA